MTPGVLISNYRVDQSGGSYELLYVSRSYKDEDNPEGNIGTPTKD